MENYLIIQNISSTPEWKNVFNLILNHCDQFEVIFPEGNFDVENPLMGGKLEFEKLEDTLSNSWDGMKDSICLSGSLTKDVKSLIYELEQPSFIGDKPELWNFKLLRNGQLYLRIEDFTVCLLENHKELLSLLGKNGIDSSTFE